jgi:nucleoprotein TPR
MQAQHAAELDALRARLDQTAAAGGGDGAIIAQIEALKAHHAKELDITRDNTRKELEARAKMMQLQMTKLRQENTVLKAAQNQAVAPPATTTSVTPTLATPAIPSVPATPTDAAAPPAAVVAPPPVAGTPRGRGVGRGTPSQRGGPVGRGRGRGTVLDSVNHVMQNNQPPLPAELSILGAGQKRQREEETDDPGSLAKRLKPGEASLPAKPVPLNRNRPGAPGN